MTPDAESSTAVDDLAEELVAGERRALAQAITLAESARPDHQQQAATLLDAVLPQTGAATRIGVSGAPGAGKSTFIEVLGVQLTDAGHRVAVLAVDPSSSVSGGSILGDKTRMEELSRREAAFIRPSPSGGTLGGVARRTREAMLLCEAAGFDVVLIETVGVGQSETAVADLVDLFLVLVSPGGGDELQGIKRGIMELADIVVVNKADGDLEAAAGRVAADYTNALHLMRPKWRTAHTRVLSCSALEERGVDEIWTEIQGFRDEISTSGELAELRRRQAVSWMWSEVEETALDQLRSDPEVADVVASVESRVSGGDLSPATAAREILEAFRS